MDILAILALGLVQGITEAVPLSSKTQDTVFYLKFLHGDPSMVIPILLYLNIGSIFSALIYFRREIWKILTQFLKNPLDIKAHSEGKLGYLFTALLFTGIVGMPLLLAEKKFFPTLDLSLIFALMGAGLLLTGLFLLLQKGAKVRKAESAGWKDGILTGALQGLSILPGVSRSGSSITGLIWRGFDSESSYHLSFLLSVPTIFLAEVIIGLGGGGLGALPVADGLLLAISAFVFGYLTIDTVLKIMRRVNLAYLAFGLGTLMIAVGLLAQG